MSTTTSTKTASSRPVAAPAPRGAAGVGIAVDPIRVVRRHLTLLVVAFVLGGGIGVGAFFLCQQHFPRYTERVLFEVTPPLRDPLDPVGPTGEREEAVIRLGRTEIERLLSRDTLRRAIQNERLIRNETTWIRQFTDAGGNIAIEDAIDDLRKTLRADMLRNANIFYLEWSAPNATDVATVLRGLAEHYVRLRERDEAARFNAIVAAWDEEVGASQARVNQVQSEIDRFVRDHNITTNDPRSSQLMKAAEDIHRRINEVQSDLSSAESNRSQTEAKLVGAIEPSDDDRRMAEEDPLIRAMTGSINDLRVALSAARERFGPGHQQIISLEQRLRAAEVEREAAIRDTIRRNLDARLKGTQLQVERLSSMLDSLNVERRDRENQLNEVTARLLELEQLMRQRDREETSRRSFEDAKNSAMALAARQDASRVRVLVWPDLPRERSFPRFNVFAIGGAVGLLGLVLGLVFLREMLDQRVRAASDLAVIPGARTLGVIPDLADDPTRCRAAEMVVRERPQSVMAEAYRQAAVPLMKAMGTSGHQTLLVLGAMPESGVTTVAVNIAWCDAARGQRVLLIDANFRRPRVAAVTGIREDRPGLGDILAGTASADDAIQAVADGLSAISAGTPSTRIIERLASSKVDALLAELRTRFDVIVVDSPPAVVASEAMSLANRVDATLLVVRALQEQRGLVARLVHQLADLRSDFMGIVLNRPRGTAGGYLRKNYEAIADYAREK